MRLHHIHIICFMHLKVFFTWFFFCVSLVGEMVTQAWKYKHLEVTVTAVTYTLNTF